MGTVWLAEQAKRVSRRVALKLIKPGLDSGEVLSRFEIERQALALMNHQNIARILDAGTTSGGQPYFAMELVDSVPLTDYCDQHRLSINERLTLFVDVCNGVQHAHQKGIIHRDLKPSNILVAKVDGLAVPKIIDFGLAKATDMARHLTDSSAFTRVGQILGTIKYMSPEQAGLDAIDIDTRADIYSLGAILYELLTGASPLEQETLRGADGLKILEIIREQMPPKPSSRLSKVSSGDLDWIVMKALDKDRGRRYGKASDFAADIRRHLNNDPVTARPRSAIYRCSRFVRKNRIAVGALASIFLFLVIGIFGVGWERTS